MTAAAEAPAVELSRLGKRYGEVDALAGVSLTVSPGGFLVLLGPSGSGKSTLIRCLAGIERPSEGSVSLAGALVADGRRHVPPDRRDLAMVFQDFALWPHMTALDNVRFALRRRRLGGKESRLRAGSMLERVGLGAMRERYPHELSGGEQQRVALARALVASPALLLFDEPLSALDASLREQLRIEIGTLVRESGASAVYITHDQREAFALADEIGVLERGRLVQLGRPEDIYGTPVAASVARFTGLSAELRGKVAGAAGSRLVRVRIDGAGELLARSPGALAPGQPVEVLVRPAAVELTAPDDAAASLSGQIADSAFRGRGYDHVVRLPGGTLLTEVFSRRSHRRAEAVGLRIDPEGCLTFTVGGLTMSAGQSLQIPANGAPRRAKRDEGVDVKSNMSPGRKDT